MSLCDRMNCSLRAPLSMGFPRQEYWSWLPFSSPGDLPDPGIKPGFPDCRQILYHLNHQGNPCGGFQICYSFKRKKMFCVNFLCHLCFLFHWFLFFTISFILYTLDLFTFLHLQWGYVPINPSWVEYIIKLLCSNFSQELKNIYLVIFKRVYIFFWVF